MTPLDTKTTPDARRLVQGVALAAGVAALGVASAKPARAVSPALKFSDIPGTGNVKVLNYALALEDLESDLYVQALQRLTTGGTNALGTTITGLGLSTTTDLDARYIAKYSATEREHRDFLRAAITAAGATPITPYKYNFGMESLTRPQVTALIYTAEKTGAGAYLGAIKFFADYAYAPIAAAIQGTEARHTATFVIIQNILGFTTNLETAPLANENNGIDQPIEPDTVLATVSPFIVVPTY